MTTPITPRTGVSISQSRARQNFASMAQAYKALTRDEQNGWLLLGKQMLSATRKPRPLSGGQAFTQLNGVRLSCGMDMLTTAPAVPDMPPGLPPVRLIANLAGGVFSLRLAANSGSSTAQVWGARPVLAGHDIYHPSAFKLLGIAAVSAGVGVDITEIYQQQFKTIVAGDKIALTLYALSETGFRGPGLVVASVALGMGVESAGDAPVLKAA